MHTLRDNISRKTYENIFAQASRLLTTEEVCRSVYHRLVEAGELKQPADCYALYWPDKKVPQVSIVSRQPMITLPSLVTPDMAAEWVTHWQDAAEEQQHSFGVPPKEKTPQDQVRTVTMKQTP